MGIMVKFKEKCLRVYFKYERLPTLYIVCWRIGHQLIEYEALGDLDDEVYEDLD